MRSTASCPCSDRIWLSSSLFKKAHSFRLHGLFLCLLISCISYAGTTGKIAGKITDAENGEGIIGAAVQIEGTTMGAAADIDGNYFILNVPPGRVNLRISSLGYSTKTIEGIQVSSDQTVTIDVELQTQSLQGEEVTIVAERELVQIDRTFGSASVASEELEALPITNLNQAVEIQAGVVDGHFRGGRSGEVLYLVDGVTITDAYDNSQSTQVDQSAVQELQVISGTFNAEYGQAQSGVVNIVTKEGGDKYGFRVSSEFGDYVTSRDETYLNIDDVSPLAIQDYRVTVDGPMPRVKNLYFYASGRYQRDDGWLYGQRRWGLEHEVLPTDSGFLVIPNFGDSSYASMNSSFERFGYGKLTWNPMPRTKLVYSNNSSRRIYRDYDHGRKFVPDATKRRYRTGYTNTFKWNQTVDRRTITEASYTNMWSEYHDFLYEDPNDARYVNPAYDEFNSGYTLDVGGNDLSRFRRWTQTHQFQGNVASQVTTNHLLKGGLDVKLHRLSLEDIVITDGNPNAPISNEFDFLPFEPSIPDVSSLGHDVYKNDPWELGLYLQDKIELRSLIINAGVRLDYFNPDGRLLSDPKDPNIYSPTLPTHAADSLWVREGYWYKKVDAKSRISPRLGVAYPMSDVGVFHFSYGHFVQRPSFEILYQNPEFELEPGVGLNTVIGNADLKMEETVSYEFGFQQQVAENLSLNTSIYYRDIRNLVATDKIVETYSSGTRYAQYINRSYGAVKGVTLSLDRRMADNVSAFLDYTFQTAQGDASDRQSAFNAMNGENPREPNRQVVPLDWDRRHTMNASVTYSVPGSFGWGGTALGTYGSGLPYSPVDQGIRTGFENDGRKPDYFNVDLSAYKKFALNQKYTLTLTTTIQNVFDIANENTVYNDTGRATYSQEERRAYEIPYINTLDEVFNNPSYYSRPRVMRVGMEVSW